METSFLDRLCDPRPILLDGPTGTELTRRGVPIDTPLWSAAALLSDPDVVREIHHDYVDAGADIITANTFRTHAWSLQTVGWSQRAKELTRRAVDLAREAAGDRAWVAGSLAPLADCYRPELAPPIAAMDREHAVMAEQLAEAGVDLILVETHNSIDEFRAASQAAARVGLPVLASVVCGADGRLLSGERLNEAAEAVAIFEPVGLLVNCLPMDAVIGALDELRQIAGELPIGGYANAGVQSPDGRWIATDAAKPAVYAAAATTWIDQGARIIGGCCGTSPAHISSLRQLIDGEKRPEPLK